MRYPHGWLVTALLALIVSCGNHTINGSSVDQTLGAHKKDERAYIWSIHTDHHGQQSWHLTTKESKAHHHDWHVLWRAEGPLDLVDHTCVNQPIYIPHSIEKNAIRMRTCPSNNGPDLYTLQLQQQTDNSNSHGKFWQDIDTEVYMPAQQAKPNMEIYGYAKLVRTMYDMAKSYQNAEDYLAVFPYKHYSLDSVIFSEQSWFGKGSKQFYGVVAQSKSSGDYFVVLRGTMTVGDWVNDIEITQQHWITPKIPKEANVKVHHGFFKVYNSLNYYQPSSRQAIDKPLVERYLDWQAKGKNTYIIGHSLGAAAATIMATDIAIHANNKSLALYTLAAPKAGNHGFAEATQHIKHFKRVANVQDVITHIPFNMGYQYTHSGEQVAYAAVVQPQLRPKVQQSAIACWHHIETYLALLNPKHDIAADESCWHKDLLSNNVLSSNSDSITPKK